MSQRVVPSFAPNTVPISGLDELQTHLEELTNDASQPFNLKLLDDVELQLTETNIPPLLPILLPPLTTILKTTPQDPTPIISLTTKLLSPLNFTRALTIADPPSLVSALRAPLPGANLLACAVLHKAAASPADAAILSTLPELLEELVRRWLETEDVGVGERCGRVLGDVLETDCEVVEDDGHVNGADGASTALFRRKRTPGHGRIWKLFLSEPILNLIPLFCTPSSSRTRNQTSLSQGRLLRLLPRLTTLNIHALTHTSSSLFPATASDVGNGLLPWAALGMVDAEDVLMRLSLVDFFEALVSVLWPLPRDAERDGVVRRLVKAAARQDGELVGALRGLPDRTIEDEAEALRRYISLILA